MSPVFMYVSFQIRPDLRSICFAIPFPSAPALALRAEVSTFYHICAYIHWMVGYAGGIRVRQAVGRYLSSCWAVGRLEYDLLQQNYANSQTESGKPRDWASKGPPKSCPLSIAGTGVQTDILHSSRPRTSCTNSKPTRPERTPVEKHVARV